LLLAEKNISCTTTRTHIKEKIWKRSENAYITQMRNGGRWQETEKEKQQESKKKRDRE
jgi:hypothetical protein